MNNRGKNVCNELKKMRRRIAEENEIPFEIKECTYHGPCRGTCPRCEAEVRYLERELENRIRLGRVATVAGVSLGLASCGTGAPNKAPDDTIMGEEVMLLHENDTADVPPPPAKLLPVQGTIVDIKTKEPLPFCNVSFTPTGATTKLTVPKFATTDFDGIYKLELPEGDYTMRVAHIGCQAMERAVKVAANSDTIDLSLEATAQTLGGAEAEIMCGIFPDPIIEYGPEMGTNTEMQGVPLRVQY